MFPLNSLMLHGIIYAKENRKLNTDPGHDFANEVHSYFATGTELQELYITPSLLSDRDWDVLAESANWSRENADVLRDTHWIGGDPDRLEVYGWASWSPGKSIITLRNPSDRAQLAVVDLQRQLALPAGAAHRFRAHSPWKSDAAKPSSILDAVKPGTVTLAPFEVLTLELTPVTAGSWGTGSARMTGRQRRSFGPRQHQALPWNSSRPISMRRISFVPAPISYSLASRSRRPAGKSLM